MKTHTWKKLGIILGILALVLIIIGIVTPMLLDLNRYHGFIVSEVEKAVGGQVKLGRISWGITHRIWLQVDGFSIIDASAFPGEVKFTRIYTSVSIPRLLTKKVVLKNLRLESSEVKLRLEPATKEIGPPADDTKSAGVQLPVEIEIRRLAVAIKRLELGDAMSLPGQTLVHVFSDVDLAATNIAPAEIMAFNLSLRDKSPSGLGTLKAQGTFRGLTKALTLENPDLKLKATLEKFHVDVIKPYLKNSQLKNQLSGTISMEANCEGDPAKNLKARGVIDLSSITYKDPSRWETALPGQKTTITFQINLDPQNLSAEKIALKLGRLSLDARAELHGWKKDPVVTKAELSSDLPLLDMIPLIPWKMLGNKADVIRSILEGGGKIVLNKVVFPEIRLAKLPATVNDLLSGIEMTAQVAGVSVQPSPNLLKIEDIAGRVSLQNNVLVAENIHSRLGAIALPTLNIQVTDIATEPKGTIRVKGPLQVAASGDAQIEKLLRQHGLKRLTGSVDIDMRADFDQRRPKDWTAKGSLVLQGVRAQAHPANVVLENLEGAVEFNRKKVINISARDIRAQINQAPVKMSGRFIDVGAPNMLISTRAYAEQLDLSHLAEFIPTLKDLKLSGQLSMNLDVHVPYATPVKSRLTGTLTTQNAGFQLAAAGLAVENGNTQIVLAGDSASIKAMTLHVNDQKLAVSGRLSNPVKPNAKLLITSPDLDLDRLLPQKKVEKPSSTALKGGEEQPAQKFAPEEKSSKKELPPAARKLTADLQVKAVQGRYRGLQFKKLNLNLLYKRGVIEHYDLNFGVDEGRVDTKGSADIRDLDHITFTVAPDIRALHLEKVAPVFGIGKPPYTGPMSLSGRLKGRTGSMQALLASLTGHLETEMGPGKLTKIGRTGELMLKILSMTSIRGILSGSLVDDLTGKGLSFREIKAETAFDKGSMALKGFQFVSDAMMMNSHGNINLIDEQLDLDVVLEPLRGVSKAIGSIPLVGKAAEDLTEIRLEIKGPFEKPEIRPAEAKQIGKGIKSEVKEPETTLKDFGDRFKKIF